MYDHIGLRVKDIEASKKFYKALLAPLGYGLDSEGEGYAGFGPKAAPALWLHATSLKSSSGVHLAFKAPDRKSVDAFHRAGLKAGGKDNGAPGLRTDYSPKYYAAFIIDPDGNNVEAVCTR
jgi:catechol 2,3-dioxygenase-like lactoylglutathione lyase family enzyme